MNIELLKQKQTILTLSASALSLFVWIILFATPIGFRSITDGIVTPFLALVAGGIWLYGLKRALKLSYQSLELEGHHKYQYRLFFASIFIFLIVLIIYLIPLNIYKELLGIDQSILRYVNFILMFKGLSSMIEVFMLNPYYKDLRFIHVIKLLVFLITIILFRLIGLEMNSILISLIVMEGMYFIATSVLFYQNLNEIKFKKEFEDSGLFIEGYKIIVRFLSYYGRSVLLVLPLTLFTLVDMMYLESHPDLIGIYILFFIWMKLMIVFIKPAMEELTELTKKSNFSGMDRNLNQTMIKVSIITLPVTVFLMVYAAEWNQVFIHSSALSYIAFGLLVLIVSLVLVTTNALIIHRRGFFAFLGLLAGLTIQWFLSDIFTVYYESAGLVIAKTIGLAFAYVIHLLALQQYMHLDLKYFMKKALQTLMFLIVLTGLLAILKYAIAPVIPFSTNWMYITAVITIGTLITVVVFYAFLFYTGFVRLFIDREYQKTEYLDGLHEIEMEGFLW